MTDGFATRVYEERLKLGVRARGGVAAPLAGTIYWAGLGSLGLFVTSYVWCLIAFVTSGLIFPLALLLQRPTRSNVMIKDSPLASAGTIGFVNVAVGWSVTIAAFFTDHSLVPLTLAVGMSLHFPGIGWSYGSRVLMIHPLVRTGVITVVWFAWPAARFTALPYAVSVVYLATVVLVLAEVKRSGAALAQRGVATA